MSRLDKTTFTLAPTIHCDSANWKHFDSRHEAVGAKAILERRYGSYNLIMTGNPPVHRGTYVKL